MTICSALWNTCFQNVTTQNTGCIRALYGDWNDALDGLGVSTVSGVEYGTGVSVMATLQVYQNLGEMLEILESLSIVNIHPIV